MSRRLRRLAGVIAVALATGPLAAAAPANGAVSHALIQGSGSSWAANAVDQWVQDVKAQGLQVVYNPGGDAQGRQDFANKISDFAVTSIGYQGRDPLTGVSDTSRKRAAEMLPDVPLVPPAEVLERAELVLLTVPDDTLPALVEGLAETGSVRPG